MKSKGNRESREDRKGVNKRAIRETEETRDTVHTHTTAWAPNHLN